MPPSTLSARIWPGLAVVVAVCSPTGTAAAPPPSNASVSVTIAEAVELAVANNHRLRQAQIDVRSAKARSRAAWSGVLPRVDGRLSYTRTVLAANPFAGSGAGGAFGALGAVGWLQFNEAARTDADPTTNPITLSNFQQQTNAAQARAGVVNDPDRNQFLVENQMALGLSLSQVLYDDAIFAGLEAAEIAEKAASMGVKVESLSVVREASQAFYGGLLAARQTEILSQSVARARKNEQETGARVEQGTLPEFQLITAEVERANLETSLARAEAAAETAVDALRAVIGLAPEQRVVLKGTLDLSAVELAPVTVEEAVGTAYEQRPDLRALQLSLEADTVSERVARAGYLPRVSAVANLAYNGSVPDDRSFSTPANNAADPFAVQKDSNGVFADPYWFPTFSIGVQLQWNLFEGFATQSRLDQQRLATERTHVGLERARLQVRLEVERSLRDLATSKRRIDTQTRIRERAELNYEQVEIRLREGISTQFDLRQASEQLDDSRFNYLQAVHDYLVAHVAYQVALGAPPQP